MIPSQQRLTAGRSYIDKAAEPQQKPYEKPSRLNEESQYTQKTSTYTKTPEPTTNQRDYGLSSSNIQMLAGISSRKTCG